MLSSSDLKFYVVPEHEAIQKALETAKFDDFRLVWNLYKGSLRVTPKSSDVIFGVDLGIYTKESDVDDVKEALYGHANQLEVDFIAEEIDESTYLRVKRGEVPIQFIEETDTYYSELKEIVDRRVNLYD